MPNARLQHLRRAQASLSATASRHDSANSTPTQRPRFQATGIATIKHLNIRKDGPDDDKILAVDVKLSFEKLPRVLLDYFDVDGVAVAFLWRGNTETDSLIVRNAFLEPIKFMNQLDGASVQISGVTFLGCEVKNFAIQPRDGGSVDMACSVSIYPSSAEVAKLASNVQDGARVSITGPADLFDKAVTDAA